ncbi:hypothetical protein NLY44_27340 [Mesorhizobium sp. C089B]|uniref:hypothetical protein n=1 Tax=Mesorhizobium sp. C089B TaxID=2956823 RepID=UPI0025768FEA|nr:hypothetical protein [Mesorhizobium sp. C089B]WJI50257.1 hypothetical protein NLY44_27340 [Mesorhizobium sp. C089B]
MQGVVHARQKANGVGRWTAFVIQQTDDYILLGNDALVVSELPRQKMSRISAGVGMAFSLVGRKPDDRSQAPRACLFLVFRGDRNSVRSLAGNGNRLGN